MRSWIKIGSVLWMMLLSATSVMAFPAGHDYTVQLSMVDDAGLVTVVEELPATSDATGRLNFHFQQVPDSRTAAFLMVDIMDSEGGGGLVRKGMVPAPDPGEALQMGVDGASHRRARAMLSSFAASGRADAGRAMFAQMLVPGGAVSTTDAELLGQMADHAEMTFEAWLSQAGVTASEMEIFRGELKNAMQSLAEACRGAVQQTDPVVAAGMHGTATGQFMQAVIDAGYMAGIDANLLAAAFDQAGQMLENSPLTGTLSSQALDAMYASFMIDGQQRQLHAEMRRYQDAMMVLGANAEHLQRFMAAMTTLQEALFQARHDFQMVFADPSSLPDQTTIGQARMTMDVAMQAAVDEFRQATTASDAAVSSMLDGMAGQMAMMGGSMGGGMMTGNDLAGMGFGRWQVNTDGTTGNWSIMMVAAGNHLPQVPGMAYAPISTELENQLAQLPSLASSPVAHDWGQLADSSSRGMLQLQYDLMLENLVMEQTAAGMVQPLTAADRARLTALHRGNLQAIHQGVSGMTTNEVDALVTVMTPPYRM